MSGSLMVTLRTGGHSGAEKSPRMYNALNPPPLAFRPSQRCSAPTRSNILLPGGWLMAVKMTLGPASALSLGVGVKLRW